MSNDTVRLEFCKFILKRRISKLPFVNKKEIANKFEKLIISKFADETLSKKDWLEFVDSTLAIYIEKYKTEKMTKLHEEMLWLLTI